jgi:hypothetical protein
VDAGDGDGEKENSGNQEEEDGVALATLRQQRGKKRRSFANANPSKANPLSPWSMHCAAAPPTTTPTLL